MCVRRFILMAGASLLVSACGTFEMGLETTPHAVRSTTVSTLVTPKATPALIPTDFISPFPTPESPHFSATETPELWEKMRGFEYVLPSGSTPLYDQIGEWTIGRAGDHVGLIIVPYRLPDGKVNLAVIAGRANNATTTGPTLCWDWQRQTVKPGYWKDIRRPSSLSGSGFSFVGLDENEQWWLVTVAGNCTSASPVLFPLSQPERVFLTIGLTSDGVLQYWVLDNAVLTLYEWKGNKATALWTLDNVPGFEVRPRYEDMTGDGQPELILIWPRDTGEFMQIYQSINHGFRLIGEVEPYYQYTDVDADNVPDFLWPVSHRPATPDTFTAWIVYGWNGERFVWKKPLPAPSSIHHKKIGTPSVSPDCPYTIENVPGQIEGSSSRVRSVDAPITWSIPNSGSYSHGYSTFAWDPNCKFLIHASADGINGLYRLDLASGKVDTLLSLGHDEYYGAVDPLVLTNGDIIFTIQGTDATLYPPLGIYLLATSGELQLLRNLPTLSYIENGRPEYGTLTYSPKDGFVYQTRTIRIFPDE